MRLGDIAKDTSLDLKVISEQELVNLHKVLLIILDDLIKVCRENNLKFILIGGSAIGAFRHKGFIPWDDDIDIAMPRKDFEKLYEVLIKKYKDKYSILHPQSRDNFGRILPKIRLKNTEYRTILESDLVDCGVFIDVYIIENIPDSQFIKLFHGLGSLFFGFALSCRRMAKGYGVFKKYKKSLSLRIKACIGIFMSFASLETWARWTDHWYSLCKNENTEYVGVPSDDFHYFGEIYRRDEFCQYEEVDFEGRVCLVPKNYKPYLSRRYGDYMVMPDPNNHDRNCYLAYDLGEYGRI